MKYFTPELVVAYGSDDSTTWKAAEARWDDACARYDAYEVHDCAPSHRLPAGPPGRQLAWVLDNPVVCSPIVGATKPHHLTEAVAALGLHLTDDEIHALQEPYTPHGPSWF